MSLSCRWKGCQGAANAGQPLRSRDSSRSQDSRPRLPVRQTAAPLLSSLLRLPWFVSEAQAESPATRPMP